MLIEYYKFIKLKLIAVHYSLYLFRILFRTLNHQYDYTFDWTMLKQLNAPPNNMIKADNREREKEKQHTAEAPKIIN